MPLRDLALVFPGQGSQKVGMLGAAYAQFPEVALCFAEASDALGYDVWQQVQDGPQERLNLTEITQPVLMTASVALWRAWQAQGGAEPAMMAGHSLGEFSALVAAGSLSLADGVRAVRERGRFMQEAVPVGVGAMAAIIGLDDRRIVEICAEMAQQSGRCVAAVNFNSPGQVVIAGHADAVELAIAALKVAGAKRALPLPVSAPFHTALMNPAAERLAAVLDNIELRTPRIPVVHNVHAQCEADPERIRALLVEQIASPVLWTQCVSHMVMQGCRSFVECGPGKVLGGLVSRSDSTVQVFSSEEPDRLLEAIKENS
jgi:[acyl-carrier-protein] S-malonyltransferase